jgi:hypothetical protein
VPDTFSIEHEEVPSAILLDEEPELEGSAPQQDPAFVAEVPDSVWAKNEAEIRMFLDSELALAQAERSEFIEKLARWKVVYRAPPPDTPKNFPIRNASNVIVPLVKEIANTLAAQAVQTTMTAEPRWVLKDLADEWDPYAPLIERFLDIASRRDLKMDKAAISWIIEAVKMGTSITEVAYEVEQRRVYQYDSKGQRAYPKVVTVTDGPVMFHIPLSRFWIRFHEDDIQRARWVAKELDFSERDLRDRVAMGKFDHDAVESLLPKPVKSEGDVSPAESVDEEIEKTKPTQREEVRVFEIRISWDLDGDGVFEELRLWYNWENGKFLRKEYAPEWHGRRPFIKIGFFPIEDRFYDEGICEMLEPLQRSLSEIHNRRADNATLANAKMIIKRKMLKSLRPGDPLYSGKIIEVNDIWNDIREFQMADIYPSTVQEEGIVRNIAERLSGHSDAAAGGGRPITRTTATAEMALLQEQAKRLDLAIRNIRSGLNDVGWFTMNLYFQYGTNGKALAWMGEKGRIVEAVFRLPRRLIQLGMAIETNTPTSTQNRQVKRENSIALFNLMVQMYGELLPLAAQLAPEGLGEVTHALVASAKKFMGDTLAAFEVSDPEDVLAGLTTLEQILPDPRNLGGVNDFARREESAALLEKLERVEGLLLEAEGAARRGDGVRPGGRGATPVSPIQGVPRRDRPGTSSDRQPLSGLGDDSGGDLGFPGF